MNFQIIFKTENIKESMLTGKIVSHSDENLHVHDPKPTPLLSISPETQNLPSVSYIKACGI